MKITIEKKKAFLIAGLCIQSDKTTDFSKLWNDLFTQATHSELALMGSGQSYGMCYDVSDCNSFHYMAGYDCTDEQKAAALGLSVMHIPEAEYAVVQLKRSVRTVFIRGGNT